MFFPENITTLGFAHFGYLGTILDLSFGVCLALRCLYLKLKFHWLEEITNFKWLCIRV